MGSYDLDTAKDGVVQVLEGLAIYDVVAGALGRGNKRGQLRKKEDTYYALCPFHTERTPSFVVFPKANGAGCLGCGIVASPAEFIIEYYGSDSDKRFLDIIQENNPNLFDFISKNKIFDSEEGFSELRYSQDWPDISAGVCYEMERSLHYLAYMRKEA